MLEFKKILVQVFQYGTAIIIFIAFMKIMKNFLKKLSKFLEKIQEKLK